MKDLILVTPYTAKTFVVVGPNILKHKKALEAMGGYYIHNMRQKADERDGNDSGFGFRNSLITAVEKWFASGKVEQAPDRNVEFVKTKLAAMKTEELKAIKKYINALIKVDSDADSCASKGEIPNLAPKAPIKKKKKKAVVSDVGGVSEKKKKKKPAVSDVGDVGKSATTKKTKKKTVVSDASKSTTKKKTKKTVVSDASKSTASTNPDESEICPIMETRPAFLQKYMKRA